MAFYLGEVSVRTVGESGEWSPGRARVGRARLGVTAASAGRAAASDNRKLHVVVVYVDVSDSLKAPRMFSLLR